jgi:phage-related protein
VLDKALVWLGSTRGDIRRFPPVARRVAGFQLRRVQNGLDPNDWKPMSNVGAGVREVRLHVEGEHRVFYVATFAEAVYVLHAFEKKTQKTTARDLEIGRERFRLLVAMRRKNNGSKKRR